MSEHPNAKLVRHGYDAFARGNLDALREFMAPDVVWHEPGRGPLAGDHQGPKGVLALLGELRARSNGTFAVEFAVHRGKITEFTVYHADTYHFDEFWS